MYPPTKAAKSTIPLATCVQELHELFALHRLPFGSPEDVTPFTAALTAPGTFRDEMTSMIRSIFLRHGGDVPRADLLQLVMVAVGGPHIDESAEQYLPAIQEIVSFLGEVHRTRWGVIPTELPAADAAGAFANAPPRYVPTADRELPVSAAVQPEPANVPAPDLGRESLPPRRTSEMFFRSQMMRATPDAAPVADAPTPQSAPQSVVAAPSIAIPEAAAPHVILPAAAATPEVATANVAAAEPEAPQPATAETFVPEVPSDIPAVAAPGTAATPEPAAPEAPIVESATAKPAIPAPAPAPATLSAAVPAAPVVPAAAKPESAAALTPKFAVDAGPTPRKALWVTLAAVVLLVATIAGVMFYEQYMEDKNWPTHQLPPAATAPPSPQPSPAKPAAVPTPAAKAPVATAPVLARPAHPRVTPRPAPTPVRNPLPPAVDAVDQATPAVEQNTVPSDTAPAATPQDRQPAPVFRTDPAAPAPPATTAPNPPSNTTSTTPQ